MWGLIRAIVIRDFKGLYRRSVLGPFWVVLQPFLYLVVFGSLRGILKIPSDGVPYAVFLFSGLVPYMFLSSAINRGIGSIAANAPVVKKMSVRCEIFPIAAVLNAAIDASFALVILFGLALYYEVQLTWYALWVPVLFCVTGLLGFALALGGAALGTFRHDITMAIPITMQVWLIGSPIIYPMSQVPERWLWLYQLNPLAGIVDGVRQALLFGTHPDMYLLFVSCAWVAVILLVTVPLFRYLSRYFSDVLA